MPKLLIIADDLTGALDTGVKFSKYGLSTVVTTGWSESTVPEDVDIFVLCAATRHLAPDEAYRMIREIVEENNARFPLIMKKTDSGLRGNIGAELQAVLDGAKGDALAFLPALPEMNRTTRNGVQLIEGVPVNQSVFSRDPFEPVLDDDIAGLLRRQCKAEVRIVRKASEQNADTSEADGAIIVYDAETADDMRENVRTIMCDGKTRLFAGCAGLAQALAEEMASTENAQEERESNEPLMVVCGSVNQISTAQLDYAEKKGHLRIHLSTEYLLGSEIPDTPEDKAVLRELLNACENERLLLVDTASAKGEIVLNGASNRPLEETRQRISRKLGNTVKALLDRGLDRRIMIIGGDTLSELMRAVDCTEISPVREADRGVVLSNLQYKKHSYQILSKSGGFGEEDLLVRI